MKSVILAFIVLTFCSQLHAQNTNNNYKSDTSMHERLLGILPMKENKVTYSLTIKTNGISKDQVYNLAKKWVKESLGGIKTDNKEQGHIAGKSSLHANWMANFTQSAYVKVHETYDISITDENVSIVLTNLHGNYSLPPQHMSALGTSGEYDLEAWEMDRDGYYQRKDATRKFFKNVDRKEQRVLASFETAISG